jgi:hypothetical protein
LRYFEDGKEPSSVEDAFVTGAEVVVDRPLLPGIRGIVVNGQVCDGTYVIESNVETDIELTVRIDGCSIRTLGTHPADQVNHLDSGATLFVSMPVGASLAVRAITPGLTVPARRVSADESGNATVHALPAGSYELALVVDGLVVTRLEVSLGPGDERTIHLAAPQPTAQRQLPVVSSTAPEVV